MLNLYPIFNLLYVKYLFYFYSIVFTKNVLTAIEIVVISAMKTVGVSEYAFINPF